MSTPTALLQFAAGSVLFVAALVLAVAARRVGGLVAVHPLRHVLVGGALLLLVAACIAGSSHATADEVALFGLRAVGAVLLAIGATRWLERSGRLLLLGSAVLVVVGSALDWRGSPTGASAVLLLAGLLVWAAIAIAGRSFIAARVVVACGAVALGVALAIGVAGGLVFVRELDRDAMQSQIGVTSEPRESVAPDRDDLLEVSFLVGVASAIAAVAVGVAVGDSLDRGMQEIADAVELVRGGGEPVVARDRRPDELGALGRAVAGLARSMRTATTDLHESADREAHLHGRLEAVIAGMVEGLVVSDAEGRITECNHAAEVLLGVTSTEVVGRPLLDALWFTPIDSEGPVALDLPDDGVLVVEGSVDGPDGDEVPVIVTAGVLRDPSGTASGSVLVIRDIRKERQVERMKSDFLANISHELRTPLTPIKGYAGVLQRRAVDHAQAAGFARQIAVSVDQVERVIARLVNFATVAAGRLDLRREPTRAGDVVDALVARWQERLGPEWPVEARLDDGDVVVDVDATYLAQALDELMDNAVKYSTPGSPIVVGCVRRQSGPGQRQRLRLSVADQGVGIEADRLDELVAEFAQGDSSVTREFGGLGLGLSLAERIVRAHDGLLTCESVVGRGSRFSFLLPIDDVRP